MSTRHQFDLALSRLRSEIVTELGNLSDKGSIPKNLFQHDRHIWVWGSGTYVKFHVQGGREKSGETERTRYGQET